MWETILRFQQLANLLTSLCWAIPSHTKAPKPKPSNTPHPSKPSAPSTQFYPSMSNTSTCTVSAATAKTAPCVARTSISSVRASDSRNGTSPAFAKPTTYLQKRRPTLASILQRLCWKTMGYMVCRRWIQSRRLYQRRSANSRFLRARCCGIRKRMRRRTRMLGIMWIAFGMLCIRVWMRAGSRSDMPMWIMRKAMRVCRKRMGMSSGGWRSWGRWRRRMIRGMRLGIMCLLFRAEAEMLANFDYYHFIFHVDIFGIDRSATRWESNASRSWLLEIQHRCVYVCRGKLRIGQLQPLAASHSAFQQWNRQIGTPGNENIVLSVCYLLESHIFAQCKNEHRNLHRRQNPHFIFLQISLTNPTLQVRIWTAQQLRNGGNDIM